MEDITEDLDGIFKGLRPQERQDLKQKIYEYLGCFPTHKIEEN
jgi:hypothetical protein